MERGNGSRYDDSIVDRARVFSKFENNFPKTIYIYIYMFLETPFDLLFRSPIVTDKFFLNERREKFRRNEIRKGGKKEAGKKIRDEKKKGWERGSVVLFIGRRERLMS